MAPVTKEQLLKVIKNEMQTCDIEAQMRLDIQRTKDYQAIEKDIEDTEYTIRELSLETAAMRARQTEMLSVVKDSRPNVEEAKRLLVEIMKIEGAEGFNFDWITVSGRFSESRKVDGKRLLEVLGGDVDEFMQMAQPTQKAIKDYAAEHAGIKSDLLKCIRLEGRELVGIDVQLPEA